MKSMEIQMMDINKIIPYAGNPRNNDNAVPYVANSIKEFGWKKPIVVDKDFVIIAGHTRYKAAKQLGIKEVPVIVATDLTEEQAREYRIADNKAAEKATWNLVGLSNELNETGGDFSMFGFSSDELMSLARFGQTLDEEAIDYNLSDLNMQWDGAFVSHEANPTNPDGNTQKAEEKTEIEENSEMSTTFRRETVMCPYCGEEIDAEDYEK